ncbi:DUF2534 family protein [Rosenbergiella sp. S61]|uniref:DUF2534 family protein n=1 Tax=Rosenbergiella gaditana TaxID=2726987 RepID=A0ABS5SXP1_9GAMM|nr:DUF2534 family protein [Rosenbergiella gaditana]MBT0724868.1 DUF2534 family protein [Rosenbergiella gaditana]
MTHSVKATSNSNNAFMLLLRRLHFYIGLFIGPFIFIASLTGMLYVITPSVEGWLYASTLKVVPHGTAKPLSEQVEAAKRAIHQPATLAAVRPAPSATDTTRVQFTQVGLGPSETRAIFIDPYRLTVTGDYTVYGTSGILPFRTTLDHLHQSLLLGNVGRAYSELAASWMWIAALGGLILWAASRQQQKLSTGKIPFSQRWHRRFGVVLLLGMLFLSATGITWSQWAGDNVNQLRHAFGWLTPQVTAVVGVPPGPALMNAHAEHQALDMGSMPGMDMSQPSSIPQPTYFVADNEWDRVLSEARQSGIQAAKIEIRPPKDSHHTWTVTEINHRWPVQVDAVAMDPKTLAVIDHVEFHDYPLLAKLTRWGVDAHMGLLFGWLNQLILALFALGLCTMIIMGYRQWWRRRPHPADHSPAQTLSEAWRNCQIATRSIVIVFAALLSYALPVLGVSLVLFILIDIFRWKRALTMQHSPTDASSYNATEQRKKKRNFIRGVIVIWLITCTVMTRAIIGGVIDEYHIPFTEWSGGMYMMQGMMIIIYTSVFTGLMSIPLWYFFLGESDPQGE